MKTLNQLPNELKNLNDDISKLYYKGDLSLLKRKKVAIVGSRRALNYTKNQTYLLANKLSAQGVVIVSGAALGVDAISHRGAGSKNTIAVVASGLHHRYPKTNANLIAEIEQNGLVLSRFEPDFLATPWSFVVRNEIIVALGDVVIITQADLNSGSLRSAEFAIKHNKEIFVLPHRLGDSEGTNRLLKDGFAKCIYDIDDFVSNFKDTKEREVIKDEFYQFCSNFPTVEEAVKLFGERVFEAELNGDIIIENSLIRLA